MWIPYVLQNLYYWLQLITLACRLLMKMILVVKDIQNKIWLFHQNNWFINLEFFLILNKLDNKSILLEWKFDEIFNSCSTSILNNCVIFCVTRILYTSLFSQVFIVTFKLFFKFGVAGVVLDPIENGLFWIFFFQFSSICFF